MLPENTSELIRPMQIGNIRLDIPLALAPMAGVCDLAFREICEDFGAQYTCTEMVSARGLFHGDGKTEVLLKKGRNRRPYAVQIFGCEPKIMARGAQIALELSGAAAVDINMGCPMPKIVSNGDGSALMTDPPLAAQIIREVKRAVDCPVTVKHRAGWDDKSVNAVEFAKICEDAGADAICVHGRTAAQLYSGLADRNIIAQVKQAVSVPVFANGDIFSAEDAISMLEQTHADGIAVARGAWGSPWLFEQILCALKGEPIPADPPLSFRMDVLLRQAERAAELKGERAAMLEIRQHTGKYFKNIPGAKAMREQAVRLASLAQLREFAVRICG